MPTICIDNLVTAFHIYYRNAYISTRTANPGYPTRLNTSNTVRYNPGPKYEFQTTFGIKRAPRYRDTGALFLDSVRSENCISINFKDDYYMIVSSYILILCD